MLYNKEEVLWDLFLEGDVSAFSSIYKQYYPLLHSYGLKISNNAMTTEDCLHNFFIYLYDKRKRIKNITSVKSYLFISFRRALLIQLKKEKKFTSYDDAVALKNGFVFSMLELQTKQETLKIKSSTLLGLLNSLSTREKEAIYLKYYSNLKTKEIAEVMNIGYQSVSNTLQKAFVKLRDKSEHKAIYQILNG